ncbi:MAG: hypothetical protein V4530_12465 [Pseudomonadota bacterium]
MSDAKTDSDTDSVSAPRRSARRRWRWPLALLLVIVFLLFDIGPTVPAPGPPSAPQAEGVRLMVQRTQAALVGGNGHAQLFYTGADLTSAAVLAGNIRSLGQFDAHLASGSARFRMSQQLLGPVWINITADVGNSRNGFPPVRLRIGRLPLGEALSRRVVGLAQWVMKERGIKTPPLDTLVNGVYIAPAGITASVYLPGSGDVGRGLAGLRSAPVDAAAAARIYCYLVQREAHETTDDFAQVVNRAFTAPSGLSDPVEGNRAAFVALASYTVGPGAMRLAKGMQEKTAACNSAYRSAKIVGRDDLPKHWSLSAALSVTLGDDLSTAMGEWKELSDSRPSGTGFSFVDLAADRSGLAAAKRATDPAGASAFAARLRKATAEQIIPIGALALSEGLTEAEFVSRYGTIDSKAFADATARVDQVIARTVGE